MRYYRRYAEAMNEAKKTGGTVRFDKAHQMYYVSAI